MREYRDGPISSTCLLIKTTNAHALTSAACWSSSSSLRPCWESPPIHGSRAISNNSPLPMILTARDAESTIPNFRISTSHRHISIRCRSLFVCKRVQLQGIQCSSASRTRLWLAAIPTNLAITPRVWRSMKPLQVRLMIFSNQHCLPADFWHA